MSNIPSSAERIQIEATRERSAVSESLAQTMGGSINYSLDHIDAIEAHDLVQDSEILALQTLPKLQMARGITSVISGTTTVFTAPGGATILWFGAAAQITGSGFFGTAGMTVEGQSCDFSYTAVGSSIYRLTASGASALISIISGGGGTFTWAVAYYAP